MYQIKDIHESQVASVFPLMKELRTHLSVEDFVLLYKEAKLRDDYRLVGLTRGEICYGLMGCRVLYDLAHGKHLYIDDLVVTKDMRGAGLGRMLLQHAVQLAKDEGCQGLRLCTGLENQDGRRFYEREGWTARAVAYKMKI